MRFTSIRARVAFLSTLFSLLLVGSITFATYVLVSHGMSDSATRTAIRLESVAARVAARVLDNAAAEAGRRGLTGAEADEFIADTFVANPPEAIASGLVYEGSFTLHAWATPGDSGRVVWSLGPLADDPAAQAEPEAVEAFRTGGIAQAFPEHRVRLAGMFRRADLGSYVSFIPVAIPGLHGAVLQVEYDPENEEAILDATRGPMIGVTVASLVAALLITMLTTGWTLTLVDNLRRTADSVDVGQLDVRLPEKGQNEVTELARSLNRLIENLRRRNEAQARFIADASHELATPVAGIRGYVNILRAWGAEDPVLREEAVSAIDRESRRMARLCSDLLSVIRNEEVVEYRQIRYDINAASREVLANAATRYIDKQLEFTGPSEGALWLFGDPDRVEEALGILVDNACKYTPAGGSVSVDTRRHRERVVIEVTDTGVGIPEEDLPNVFERFYRSDVSRSKETGGFGLGLAIAKHIVDASGGSISVRSAIGKGTTFEVTLPRQKTRQG
ncbi:MAG: sensor histidine kinase [Coriobacteriia bacterium]